MYLSHCSLTLSFDSFGLATSCNLRLLTVSRRERRRYLAGVDFENTSRGAKFSWHLLSFDHPKAAIPFREGEVKAAYC